MVGIAAKTVMMSLAVMLTSSSLVFSGGGSDPSENTDGGLIFYDGVNGSVIESESGEVTQLQANGAGQDEEHGVKRLAHMKNSAEDVAEAALFDGIEVDVQETDETGAIRLYHDEYMDYTLDMFLDHCQETGQMAVLDMKSNCTYEDVVNLVTEKGMIENTVFQVGRGEQAQLLREYNPDARCWLLNGVGNEGYLNTARLAEFADCFEGINVCGTVVVPDYCKDSIDAVHAIRGPKGPMTISVFGYGANTQVSYDDGAYVANGADYLMTDLYPEE